MLSFLAVAAALTPAELDDRMRSVDNLDIDPELYRRVEEPVTLTDGPLRVRLTSGVMVPVFSGYFAGKWENEGGELLRKLRAQDPAAELPDADQRGSRELVGFIWLEGEGTVTVRMPERSDATRFANRQVLLGGAEREAMAEIVAGAPFTTTADQGIFLSADPEIDALFLGDPEGDPYEVVVYEQDDSLAGAKRLLEQRHKMWAEAGIDWAARIARDRVASDLGDPAEPALLADVRTGTRFHAVSLLPDGSQDRWIAAMRDPIGVVDQRWHTRVLTVGRTPEGAVAMGRISGKPFDPIDAEDPESIRLPPGRIERAQAQTQTFVQHHASGLHLEVEHRVKLSLRANRPTPFVDLSLPRVESVKDSFEIVAIVADGVPAATPQQTRRADASIKKKTKVKVNDDVERVIEEVDGSQVRIVFPERLEAGGSIELELRWKDTWPYANWKQQCGVERPAGSSSGVQRFLPEIEGNPSGGPWTYTATVAVPEDSKLVAAVSGVTAEREVDGGWRMITTEPTANARWPEISVGKFKWLHDDAAEGYPAVEAHLLQAFPGQLEALAPETRRVVKYLKGWMPDYPVGEIDIVEAPANCGGFVWKAPHGMAELQRSWTTGSGGSSTPKLAHAVFSHEIVHQYWGQLAQPGSLDDRWMVESFAEVYSCLYVAAAFGKEDLCLRRMEVKRKQVERDQDDKRFDLSLSEAFRQPNKNAIVYGYGPYVLERMLRPRIGNQAFFAAVDVMLREHGGEGITNERLKGYFERASGKDLSAFWSFWVDQGLLPAVEVTAAAKGGVVSGSVTSDIPFGTFDIQLEITEKDRSERVWVEVVDGEGSFELDGDWKKPKVRVDPDHQTLLRSRG